MSQVDITRDRQLFVSQVGWMAREMEEARLVDIVRWICAHLTEKSEAEESEDTRELRRLLLKRLRLDSPEQKEAEERLADILEQSFQARSPKWKTRDVAGRDVDWTETYRRALTNQPTRFVSREIDRKPDKELMGALRYQARQWMGVLDASGTPGHEERAEALRQALAQNPGPEGQSTVPMSKPLLQRLRQKGPKARKTSDALARVFAHQHTRPDEIVSIVERAIDSAEGWWNERSAKKNTVWNRLLELGVLLAITQTAVQSAWEFHGSPDLQGTFEATLRHSTAPMTLTVGKEAPGEDVFTNMRKPAGLADGIDPQDSQPDVCLTFQHTETGRSISVLGDAKRNASGDGTGYFREGLRTATYYMSAFAGALQANFVSPDTWDGDYDGGKAPSGVIRPTITLFFRQNTDPSVFQEEGTAATAESPPPILACDLENHFGLQNGQTEEEWEEWRSEFLERWLDHISDQTYDYLRKQDE
jgi:hypothetical protein